METVSYHGFQIVATPYEIGESDRWGTRVEIWRHDSSGSWVKRFDDPREFGSEDEARVFCLEFGKELVDVSDDLP